MMSRLVRPATIALACGLVLVAGCGRGKTSGVASTWANDLCSNTTSLAGVLDAAVSAVKTAQSAGSVGDVQAAVDKPLKNVQNGIEKLDEVFSSTTILKTPMEYVRNQIGKELNSVYPVYDSIDAFNSAAKSAANTGALAGALGGVSSGLAGAVQGVASLKGAVIVFKLDKNKTVAGAFTSAPECKKIKK